MINLIADFLSHFGREENSMITAFEMVLTVQIRMLMKDDLIHIELIQIGIQQGFDNRLKLHSSVPPMSRFLPGMTSLLSELHHEVRE